MFTNKFNRQFAKMNQIAEKNGWAQFITMQNLYVFRFIRINVLNLISIYSYCLLYREEEREMNNYCLDKGIAVISDFYL
jgi:hypothetical protein